MADEFAKLMSEPIQMMKKGKLRTVSVLEAFLQKTTEAALKGDAAARKDVIKLLGLMTSVSEAATPEITSEEEAQLIARFLARERRSGGGWDA
ncbi:hypothetical protein ASE63_20135 [Bosea sp. Root381]|nr:hypothetical protein ASE63_20135 [Bosea sp. Root381]